MSNYTKSTDFAAKDALNTGNPSKAVLGTEIDDEFEAIETAVATKADLASPALTGTPTINGDAAAVKKVTRRTTTTILTASDAGSCVALSGNMEIPPSVFAAGDTVMLYNNSSSARTLTQGTGLTLRYGGTTLTGSRTLAAYGMATIWFNSATEAVIAGAGLS